MNIFKSFGLKKARKVKITEGMEVDAGLEPGSWAGEWVDADDYYMWLGAKREEDDKKAEDAWKKKFAEEGHTMPERFKNRPIDAVLDDDYWIDEDKRWADKTALEKPELGEGVPVKGRGLPQKYYSDRPRPSAEGEVPGRTDFLDEKQYTKRPKGQTLADKRAGRPVLNMFKVFGLKKNEEEDEDEDKKKTPNGGENGD